MSALQDTYVNPLTDFGFKKLFGSEPNKDLLKLFEAAEIAKMPAQERQVYEDSLKYYRDMKNVVDTSREEGIKEGKEQITLQFAREMKTNNEPLDKIMRYTGLSKEDIDKL